MVLLVYKPSNFITFNDLQDTCSITGQPFYLNHVGFQQTDSFPGHLAPQFWLVSTQLILSIVIRPLYFRWPPDNLLLSQPSSTQHHSNIRVYLQSTDSRRKFEYHGKGICQLVLPEFALSQEVTGSNSNQQAQKKPETIFQDFQPFAIACVRGFELSPFPLNPHRKEVSATVFSLVTGKSQVFTIIFFFQFFSQI